ncbi:hypothetical protein JCM8208_005918 [Rhodotorula glutinis]
MWCDNCLLIFPLRAGTMALATLIAAYSIAGGIVLFLYGAFLFPSKDIEVPIYGGVSMGIGACSVLLLLAFANRSRLWTSALCFILPFVFVVSIVRAGLMVFRLDYYQERVIWTCNHGGQLYNATLAADSSYSAAAAGNSSGDTIPTGFCSAGFHSLYLAFAFALAIDCVLQLYQLFLVWRFKAFLTSYNSLKDSRVNGYYYA